MRLVGLTGGIASGKSTISNLFKSNGVPVVDADIVARDVVKKGSRGWKKVVKAFGNDILLENGDIDRARLGQIVFSDPEKRQLLNRILAPYISSGIFWEIAKLWFKGAKVIVLDIPLLFEAKMDRWTAPTIVVWVDPETQINRLMVRDTISEEQARNRINAQTPLEWKKTKADIVINNSGTVDETKLQFEKVLTQISRPLSWKEFAISRDGLLSILISVTVEYNTGKEGASIQLHQ
ncbi:Dephospho-CoA kinase, partial [Ananas comosus]